MNKYFVTIPYSCNQYGTTSGIIYADSEDEVRDLAESDQIIDAEDEENETDNTVHFYEDIKIQLEEEDVEEPSREYTPSRISGSTDRESTLLPFNTFLAELPQL